jgi:hypothetical protein
VTAAKRHLEYGILALLAVALSRPVIAQDLPAVKTLEPAGSFGIPGAPSLKVGKIVSSGKSLWFLLNGPNYSEAVKTNSNGLKQLSFALPSPSSYISGVCASENGLFGVFHFNRQIDVYSVAGALTDIISGGQDAGDCAFDGDVLYAVTGQGFSTLDGSGRNLIVPGVPPLWPVWALELGGHHIGLVAAVEAGLYVLDTNSGDWQQSQLTAPEIQGVTRPQRTSNSAAPAIFGVAADTSSGDIYAGVTPINVREGATILKFDQRARLLSRLRCKLPKSMEWITNTNKDGHFSVSHIAALDGRLLLISISQKQVLYFNLN